MLFQTFDFLLFFVPVALAFWALAHRPVARVLLLLGASYVFYVAGPKTDPLPPPWYYAGLLVFSTVLDFVCSRGIHRRTADLQADAPERVRRARWQRNALLACSLVGNLGLLAYYKYTNFLIDVVADVADQFGVNVQAAHLDLLLPIGISFYTFQSLAYTIDVWRGRLTPEPSFRKFALFVAFFPQLVAGPIVRAQELLPQFHNRPKFYPGAAEEGLFRIFKGLFKKIVFGDWIAAQFTDPVFANPQAYTSAEIMLALYAFTLQLYADFSAYTDLAIGVARLLGFRLPENFDRPYQARDVGEFWRRWHMTLSTWLRDYLFFPLGGSRGSPGRTYFNLWLTMFLVGMWHGASWNFVIYSNLHAWAMVFNRWNRQRRRGPWRAGRVLTWAVGLVAFATVVTVVGESVLALERDRAALLGVAVAIIFLVVAWLPATGTPVNTAIHVLLTFHFTVLSRVFFRAGDLEISRKMAGGLLELDTHGLRPQLASPWVWTALVIGLAYHFTPRRWVDVVAWRQFRRLPGPVLGILFCLLGLGLMKIMETGPRAFIYFQF